MGWYKHQARPRYLQPAGFFPERYNKDLFAILIICIIQSKIDQIR